MVSILLDAGADVGARDAHQNTPRMVAVPTFNRRRRVVPMFGTPPVPGSPIPQDPRGTQRELVSARYAEVRAMLWTAEQARSLAFAMGHQERLGAASWVQRLDPEVVRMVLDLL